MSMRLRQEVQALPWDAVGNGALTCFIWKLAQLTIYPAVLVFWPYGIAEHKMHAVVLSCKRARRQMLAGVPANKPTRAHEFGDGGQQVDGEYQQVLHGYGRSPLPVSHQTARADPFVRGFAN